MTLLYRLALASVAALALTGAAGAQPGPKEALPDWTTGVWMPDLPDQFRQAKTNPPPWTPEAGRKIKAMEADEDAGKPQGIFTTCLPEGMPTWMLISHAAMEVLFTPGRVTLLGETDGNRLRRIYTDGRPHPADPDPSFHGHSIGHWEGQGQGATLVVDTVAILPEVLLATGEAVGVANNGDVHVTERIHLASADILADDLTITAPHVLTAPWKTTRLFKRQKGAGADILEGVCRQGDFTEAKDKDGDAVFAPLRQKDGNILPGAQ
jgi:hypothetical protein